jgi:hypothetical protein
MMQVVQVKVCPMCLGAKEIDSAVHLPKARQAFQCTHCRGEGIVPMVTCRGCGRPAMHWDAKIPYCGRKECWDKLVEMLDPAPKARPRAIVPFGPGLEIMRGFVRNSGGRRWNPMTNQFENIPLVHSGQLSPDERKIFQQACERDIMC